MGGTPYPTVAFSPFARSSVIALDSGWHGARIPSLPGFCASRRFNSSSEIYVPAAACSRSVVRSSSAIALIPWSCWLTMMLTSLSRYGASGRRRLRWSVARELFHWSPVAVDSPCGRIVMLLLSAVCAGVVWPGSCSSLALGRMPLGRRLARCPLRHSPRFLLFVPQRRHSLGHRLALELLDTPPELGRRDTEPHRDLALDLVVLSLALSPNAVSRHRRSRFRLRGRRNSRHQQS